MKVIFLDIDGVLNTYRTHEQLISSKLKLLKEILDKTGASIVLTSAWKNVPRLRDYFTSVCFVNGIKYVGNTHSCIAVKPKDSEKCYNSFLSHNVTYTLDKGASIVSYLEQYGHRIDNYVIVDDELQSIEKWVDNDRIVKVSSKCGLTPKSAKLIVEKLL